MVPFLSLFSWFRRQPEPVDSIPILLFAPSSVAPARPPASLRSVPELVAPVSAPAPAPSAEVPARPRARPPVAADRPAEEPNGAVVLLPGGLEIVAGLAMRQEFRFHRVGAAAPEVTLGSADGAPGSHVHLPSPGVDPRHARMRFRDNRWTIANLSPDRPLTINDRPLSVDGMHELFDGDRIQLGSVTLRYRGPRP